MKMRRFLLFLLPLLPLSAAAKERFSYLYIQGDKQTPFYLRLDGAMQPRYGKNYCILSQLAPGPLQIEILFQQNLFPPEKFNVLIPESGSRGFLLVKKDSTYALYDLQQGFYLQAGNSIEEDHLPSYPAPVIAVAEPEAATPKHVMPPLPREETKATKHKSILPKAKKEAPAHKHNKATTTTPAFIPDMELGHEQQSSIKETAQADYIPSASTHDTTPAILNSDCPKPMDSEAFGKVFNKMAAQTGDEARLAYILGEMDGCYQSWQARALAQMLSTESARYTLLKRIYSRISDQASFPLLDDLFSSPTWKEAFNKLVKP